MATSQLEAEKAAQEQQVVTTAFSSILNVFKDASAITRALSSARGKLAGLQREQAWPEERREKWNNQYDKVEQELRTLVDMDEYDSGDIGHSLVDKILGDLCSFGEERVVHEWSEEKQLEMEKEIQGTITYITMLEAAKVVADAVAMKETREVNVENAV